MSLDRCVAQVEEYLHGKLWGGAAGSSPVTSAKKNMDGKDKVHEARYLYRVRELEKLGFEKTDTVWNKGVFTVTTVEVGHSSVDDWNKKIEAIKSNNKHGTVE